MPRWDGNHLLGIVEEYHALGDHQTGTPVDHATAGWLIEHLRALGYEPTALPVPFDRWVADSQLVADGEPIPHLPVFYEWEGDVDTDRVVVRRFDPEYGGFPELIGPMVDDARADGAEALVLSTAHQNGSLVAVNRTPGAGRGMPTVLVAGRDHDRADRLSRRLTMRARTEPGQTTNVVATGATPGPRLLLTTPLTGWFGCAGERGTGIAVFLALADRLRHLPIDLLATGGHELGFLGVRRWAETLTDPPAAILHLGASLAVDEPGDDGRRLVTTRLARTTLTAESGARVARALEPAGFRFQPDTEFWFGEGSVFCDLDVPLLSFTGAGIDFHTPNDTPARATSPQALAIVLDAIEAAVAHFAPR